MEKIKKEAAEAVLAEALQDVWNEHSEDTGSFPTCFEIEFPGDIVTAEFKGSRFVADVARIILDLSSQQPEAEPEQPPARPARSRSGRHDLGCHHCQEVLDRELLIGADSERGKRFTFHVLRNEYRVHHLGKVVDSGQAVEELLEVYNRI